MFDKHGRTPGCPKCEAFGPTHDERCRDRIEKALISAGEAFELEPHGHLPAAPGQVVPISASDDARIHPASATGSIGARSHPTPSTPQLLAPQARVGGGEVQDLLTASPAGGVDCIYQSINLLLHEPVIELWKDRRA